MTNDVPSVKIDACMTLRRKGHAMRRDVDGWDQDHRDSVAKLCGRAASLAGVGVGWLTSESWVVMLVCGAVSWYVGLVGGRVLARRLAARPSPSPGNPLSL